MKKKNTAIGGAKKLIKTKAYHPLTVKTWKWVIE
jgi:hypothetical protein